MTNKINLFKLCNMDFKNINQSMFSANLNVEEPSLPFRSLNEMTETTETVGYPEDLWTPYTKYVVYASNSYRIAAMDVGQMNLPAAILNNPNFTWNNNFDGILEADSSSYESFSQESSEIDSYSDVDLTDNSEDEVLEAEGCSGQRDDDQVRTWQPSVGAQLKNNENLAENNLVHQQFSRDGDITTIIPIISDEQVVASDSLRGDGRGRGGCTTTDQQQFIFNAKKQEKAKPKLPEALLLQDFAAASASHVSEESEHVVVEECDDCMYDDCMYSSNGNSSSSSF